MIKNSRKSLLSVFLVICTVFTMFSAASTTIVANAKEVNCTKCSGSGWVRCSTCFGSGFKNCYNCGGSGKVYGYSGMSTCLICSGHGRLPCTKCARNGSIQCDKCNGYGYYDDGTPSCKIEPIENGFIFYWLVDSEYSGGFDIQYSTDSQFTTKIEKSVNKNYKTNVTITGLNANTKYYVRYRVFRISTSDVKICHKWSSAETVVTKAPSTSKKDETNSSSVSSNSNSKSSDKKPKGTSISKLTAKGKGFTVTWKKQTKKTTGYQVQYSTDSKFKKNKKTVTIKGNKKTSYKVKSLKGRKKYYVRVRTYRTLNGKKYYSPWSKAKKLYTK